MKGKPGAEDKPAPLAYIVKDNGWLGGVEKPDPKLRHIPLEMTVYESEESYQEFGFWPGDAWYLNHAANRAYTLEKRKNEGNLEFPVLFVSDSINSTLTCIIAF
jgi:soluble epoxide hydrolase/lipid-phosphate phosphatase